jgi:hypothetical protein
MEIAAKSSGRLTNGTLSLVFSMEFRENGPWDERISSSLPTFAVALATRSVNLLRH